MIVQWLGIFLVITGIGLVSLPAALIVGGVLLVVAGEAGLASRRQRQDVAE